MDLEQDNFMFSFKISDYYGFIQDIDPRVLKVGVYQKLLNINLGTQEVNDTEVELEVVRCGDRFQNYDQTIVDKMSLQDMYCVDESVSAKGVYLTEDF